MRNTIKFILSMLTVMLLVTSTAFAATVPADVAGIKHEAAVTALVEEGVITGDTDGLFHAENNLTRAQACIIIVKTIDPLASMVNGTATQSASKTEFADLKGYSWAAGYIGYAVEQGIVKGYPDGTFKPGNKVSTDEMLTMVLRAAGYTDEKIGASWPADYIEKAKLVGILEGIEEEYAAYATKGMAARMTYNKMKDIKAMAPVEEKAPQGTNADKPKGVPSIQGMTFATGSFDSNMTNFAGKTVSKSVDIYTYGAKADYTKDMTFTGKAADYRLETLYKYKNTKTPAWYLVEDGKITTMVLPRDVGFGGYAYCVVDGTITTTNVDNEAVLAFETLTATKEVTWLGKKGLPVPSFTDGDGQLYELKLSEGEVQTVNTNLTSYKGKNFDELTTSNTWTQVSKYEDGVITVSGNHIAVKSNASIYVWDDENDEYKSGSLSSIRTGKYVRAYDVSDDDVTQADIVVIKNN